MRLLSTVLVVRLHRDLDIPRKQPYLSADRVASRTKTVPCLGRHAIWVQHGCHRFLPYWAGVD